VSPRAVFIVALMVIALFALLVGALFFTGGFMHGD